MNHNLHILQDIPTQWHGYWGNMGPGQGMMNWGYGSNWLGTLIWLAILIAVVIAIIALVRWMTISGGGSKASNSCDSAMEILRRRYAKGEITKEEFTAMKGDLIE